MNSSMIDEEKMESILQSWKKVTANEVDLVLFFYLSEMKQVYRVNGIYYQFKERKAFPIFISFMQFSF